MSSKAKDWKPFKHRYQKKGVKVEGNYLFSATAGGKRDCYGMLWLTGIASSSLLLSNSRHTLLSIGPRRCQVSWEESCEMKVIYLCSSIKNCSLRIFQSVDLINKFHRTNRQQEPAAGRESGKEKQRLKMGRC